MFMHNTYVYNICLYLYVYGYRDDVYICMYMDTGTIDFEELKEAMQQLNVQVSSSSYETCYS